MVTYRMIAVIIIEIKEYDNLLKKKKNHGLPTNISNLILIG